MPNTHTTIAAFATAPFTVVAQTPTATRRLANDHGFELGSTINNFDDALAIFVDLPHGQGAQFYILDADGTEVVDPAMEPAWFGYQPSTCPQTGATYDADGFRTSNGVPDIEVETGCQ